MLLSDKIDFLLNLSSTSNRQLASALIVDPSFISRLRCGKRSIPKNSTYLNDIAIFFAKRIKKEYQKAALAEIIGQNRIQNIKSVESLSLIILDWLQAASFTNSQNISQFIHNFNEKQLDSFDDYDLSNTNKNFNLQSHAYYGNEGKREALRSFFSYLISVNKPCTVLIASDENLNWLNENNSFIVELQKHLYTLANNLGYSFCRISSRIYNSDDSIQALNRWLPIYMLGKVETYYYPRSRDNLYRRTLIVAPGLAAVCSSSIGLQEKSDLTFLNIDSEMANAATREFNDYLSKCNRICKIYKHSTDCISEQLQQFIQTPGNRICKHTSLPSYTSPYSVLKYCFKNKEDIETIKKLCECNENNLTHFDKIDIITLPTIDDLKNGKIPCTICSLINNTTTFYYTIPLFIDQLKNIIYLLEKYPKYNVYISKDYTNKNIICAIEDTLSYIICLKDEFTIFEISEKYFLGSLYEYLLDLSNEELTKQAKEKEKTINTIKDYIDLLSTSI